MLGIVCDWFTGSQCGATRSLQGLQSYPVAEGWLADSVADVVNHGPSSSKEVAAIQYAQYVERQAFRMLNLSIQELLDCDTAADQGCTGGNPLLSFFFIHRYGLVELGAVSVRGLPRQVQNKVIQAPRRHGQILGYHLSQSRESHGTGTPVHWADGGGYQRSRPGIFGVRRWHF